MAEAVNHPPHYNKHPSGVEAIELIRGLNFNIASAVKYVFRRGEKGDELEDLRKAEWYLHDYLFPSGGGSRRTDLPEFGSLRNNRDDRATWDRVITAEPHRTVREFYLAIARSDANSALHTVRDLIKQVERDERIITAIQRATFSDFANLTAPITKLRSMLDVAIAQADAEAERIGAGERDINDVTQIVEVRVEYVAAAHRE